MKRSVATEDGECCRIFIGSLDFKTTWQGLKDHFKAAGEVEYASVLMTPGGQSKGCGMVDYKTPAEAAWAVELLNGSPLDGRNIVVKLDVDGKRRQMESRQMESRAIRVPQPTQARVPSQSTPQFHTLPIEEVRRVFVGNLSYNTNWQSLKDHFQQVGEVDLASVLLAHDRTSKGCGMVDYKTHEEAARAAEELNNSELDGRSISVKLDVDGKFKNRPPPGARRPVFQVQKTEQQMSLPAIPAQFNITSSDPQIASAQALQALSQMASMPGAKQLDWPTLVQQMSAKAGRAQFIKR
jgi:RNA recognition motif-containing protein